MSQVMHQLPLSDTEVVAKQMRAVYYELLDHLQKQQNLARRSSEPPPLHSPGLLSAAPLAFGPVPQPSEQLLSTLPHPSRASAVTKPYRFSGSPSNGPRLQQQRQDALGRLDDGTGRRAQHALLPTDGQPLRANLISAQRA